MPTETLLSPEDMAAAITDTTVDVLEKMFYVCTLGPAPEPAVEDASHYVVPFEGTMDGWFSLSLTAQAAAPLASNFLGVDDAAGSEASAMGELANILCGAALSRMYPNGEFQLGAPKPAAAPLEAGVRVSLELEEGILLAVLR